MTSDGLCLPSQGSRREAERRRAFPGSTSLGIGAVGQKEKEDDEGVRAMHGSLPWLVLLVDRPRSVQVRLFRLGSRTPSVVGADAYICEVAPTTLVLHVLPVGNPSI